MGTTGFAPSSSGLTPTWRSPPKLSAETSSSWGRWEAVQTQGVRMVPAVALPLAWWQRDSLDAMMANIWAKLYAWPFAHNCMFEAWTATFGFVFAITLWASMHRLLWRGNHDKVRRFRFDQAPPVAPFEFLGQLGVKRFFGAWLPLVAYIGSIALFHVFVQKPPLPTAAPSFFRFITELAVGVLLYDIIFHPIHMSLHSSKFPRWWRNLHKTHHDARPPSRKGHSLVPLETVQHSYADGFLQVASNVAVQRLKIWPVLGLGLLPKHPLSRVAHNLLVTYLLAEAHSGYDLPWMTHRAWPTIFGGARAHDAHHVQGAPNYHQFFLFPPLPRPPSLAAAS